MAKLLTWLAIVRPDVAVVTGIGPAHLEGLGDCYGVAREKFSLLTALPEDGRALICLGVVADLLMTWASAATRFWRLHIRLLAAAN